MAMGMDMGMGGDIGGSVDTDMPPPEDDFGAYEPKDEFEREAKDFLDDTKPMGERLLALKEAIKICSEEDYAAESADGPEKKSGSGLALVFGAPKKKG